jgi:DNA mismatch endonuclease (patch repair protein)
MADIYDREKRSEVMSRVRGSGNRSTELRLIAIFRKHSITGWRRKQRLPGRPDFVFPKQRLAVFVDGCFWHGCLLHGSMPRTNQRFWADKLAQNKTRDRNVDRVLRKRGWRVLRIWQHELRPAVEDVCIRRIKRSLFVYKLT